MPEDDLNSPWALTFLQEEPYHPCVPKDLYDVDNANLGESQYVKWTAFFKEVCHMG